MRFPALPFLRRSSSDGSRERCVSRDINRLVPYLCARRVLAKKVATLPVLRWPDGPGYETAATVWTDIAQDILNTGGTKRTFIGADTCLK